MNAPAPARDRHAALPGIAMLLCAMACFSASDVLAKELARRLSPVEIVWFRYLGLVVTFAPLLRHGAALRSARPSVQVVRAVALVVSALVFITALRALPVAEATALAFSSPLFVTVLSALALRERVDRVRWAVVGAGFAGVLIVMQPGSAAFQTAALLPLASSMAWAVAVVFTRKASARDGVATTMLHSGAIGLALLSLLVVPGFVAPTAREAALLVAMAAIWSAAQWLTVAAYHRGDASMLAPFAYSQILWSSVLGYLVFGQLPAGVALGGIAVILASGGVAAWRAHGHVAVPPLADERDLPR